MLMGWLLPYPILFFYFLLFHFPSHSSSLQPLCIHYEYTALLHFKNSFSLHSSASDDCVLREESSYPKTASWGNDLNCCLWDGVTCDSISGHVIGLDLSCSWLEGQFHPNSTIFQLSHLQTLNLAFNNFSGSSISSQIPSSLLANLEHLTYLYLSGNNFSGQIPSSLSNLKHLTHLYLSHNNFSGELPNVFGKLTKLEVLSLRSNNIGGQLPSSFSNLTQLVYLDCDSNKLTGPISDQICKLSNLASLSLSDNLFNGTIPNSCFSSSSLQYLSLRNNHLTGPIGPFSTHSLEFCDLSYNKLEGNIHKSVFDLVNLTELYLSSNNLSGLVNFHQFSKLQNLGTLHLSNNKFLSISFDNDVDYSFPSLRDLDVASCNINSFPRLGNLQNLYFLNLSNNNIHGKIPKWFNKVGNDSLEFLDLSHNKLSSAEDLSMRNLWLLDLSFNMLQGSLPIPSITSEFFSVSNNRLIGNISFQFCNASSLVTLNLSHNKLTGPIPQCLVAIPYLSVLDLQMNNLVGTIPTNFSKSNSLRTLHFNGNQLEGPLPLSLAHCNQLEILDVGENQIEDTFPDWLEGLQELQVLVLRENKLYGSICSSNKTHEHSFPKLRIFDVSNNLFNGSLPTAYFNKFKGMMELNDSAVGLQYMKNGALSYEEVVITWKGNTIELVRIQTTFTTIDLSNNMFNGEIPKVIGKLNSLIGLNLSHNRINGSIPQSFGNLRSLEWLDLSWNKLTGEIPTTLTNLNFLSILNLSQNQLQGIIPRGQQFGTFLNDSYEGNEGLCGFPLSKTCSNDKRDSPPSNCDENEEFGIGWKPIALGYGCGMAFGVLMGFLAFKFGKPQWFVGIVEAKPKKRAIRTRNRARASRGRMN